MHLNEEGPQRILKKTEVPSLTVEAQQGNHVSGAQSAQAFSQPI